MYINATVVIQTPKKKKKNSASDTSNGWKK